MWLEFTPLRKDQIIPMHHLRLIDVTENLFDVLTRLMRDATRVAAAVVDQAARDFDAFRR